MQLLFNDMALCVHYKIINDIKKESEYSKKNVFLGFSQEVKQNIIFSSFSYRLVLNMNWSNHNLFTLCYNILRDIKKTYFLGIL